MRLIDADELKKTINEVYEYEYPTSSGGFDEFVTKVLPNIISNASTFESENVKHGHWIPVWIPTGVSAYGVNEMTAEEEKCSVCGKAFWVGEEKNFCPNCGAKMDGVKE